MSFTEGGIFRVLPFLPSVDFDDGTVLRSPVLLAVFSATFLPAAVALDAAFFAVDFAFPAIFLAADFLAVGFLAAVFFAGAFFETTESNFLEIAALSPALIKPFEPAFTIPDDDLIPASLSFFAVALPTPGSANRVASGSFFDLPAMSSPN